MPGLSPDGPPAGTDEDRIPIAPGDACPPGKKCFTMEKKTDPAPTPGNDGTPECGGNGSCGGDDSYWNGFFGEIRDIGGKIADAIGKDPVGFIADALNPVTVLPRWEQSILDAQRAGRDSAKANVNPEASAEYRGRARARSVVAWTAVMGASKKLRRPKIGPKARFDWAHIMERHHPSGAIAKQRLARGGRQAEGVFQGVSPGGLRKIVKRAWKNRKLIQNQLDETGAATKIFRGYDPVSGQLVKFWQHADGKTLAGRLSGQ